MTILDSSLPLGLSYWYMKQSVEMGWSSNVLKMQIDSDLYSRQISNNKVNNFTTTLPAPQSDLANYLLKDPYIFDLAGAKEKADERDIEEQLVKHVTRYLLEMGNGFAFVARQKHFQVGNSDFFADLILYSIPLHAYIVVELKATPFKPEYAGQLNFYINVVDDKLRGENDNKTIGLLLCKGKDEVVAQYALTGYDQPIGISDYQLSKAIPEKLKSALPSVEEVEEELASFLDKDNNTQKIVASMKDVITTLIPRYGELNRIYKDWFDNKGFSFEKQKFITKFYLDYNDVTVLETAILELVFHLPQEQYTLILNSLKRKYAKT